MCIRDSGDGEDQHHTELLGDALKSVEQVVRAMVRDFVGNAVSYTHLTLPTSDLV